MATVLLVDDERDIAESYGQFIEVLLGWKVLLAFSGPQALSTLEKELVDVIVSDYRMPEMDGLQFLALAHEIAPTVPCVMLTAYPDPEVEQKAAQLGVFRFLGKGANPRELTAAIEQALQA